MGKSPAAPAAPDPDDPKRFGRNPTSHYQGGQGAWWGYASAILDNKPVFTWLDVPRMLRDPHVRFLERMWRAPFQKVKFKVTADNPKVAKFVQTTIQRFWKRSLPKILSRYWRYGYAPGGAEFAAHKNLWRLDRVRSIEPRHAQPRVWTKGPDAGRPAGFAVGGGGPVGPDLGGALWVGAPHAFWFAGFGDLSSWFDAAPIAGLFDPWLEKRGRNGAVDSRKLWFRKLAIRGRVLRHPPGKSNIGTDESPNWRDNQDIAREALDYMESGSHLTLTNEMHPDGSGKYLWELEDAESFADAANVREYPQDLDKEMSTGAGIPPEVLEAAETGSGWSGRLIPLLGYLGTVDELAGLLVEACEAWLRPLVRVNFGRSAWYELEPLSLADEIAQQQGKGAAAGNPVPGLFDGKAPPPAAPPTSPLSLSATPHDAPHRYSCVYVPVGEPVASLLRMWANRIPEEDLADKGREREPHVTARFGLETDDPGALAPILRDTRQFPVRLGKVSVFPAAPGRNYDVVKVDADAPQLRRLNRELASLPHTDTHPTYHPHATIAYVRAGLGQEWAARFGAVDAVVVVDTVVFSDRSKNKTRTLLAAPLAGVELSATDPPPAPASGTGTWSPYTGPKGGRGWISATGEVRYQEAQPAAHEASADTGIESIAKHPDFAKLPHTPVNPDLPGLPAVRKQYVAAAEAAGVAPHELHRAAAENLERGLHDWKGIVEGGHQTDVPLRGLVRTSYENAHRDLAHVAGQKKAAAELADHYFDDDDPRARAKSYLDQFDGLDADQLDPDLRAAIAEDLAALPRPELAAHVAHVIDQYMPESAAYQIATEAAKSAAAAKPPQQLGFDGNPEGYFVVTKDDAGEDLFNGLKAAASLLPAVKVPLDPEQAILVKAGTPLGKLATEEYSAGYDLSDESGLKPLFNALKTGYQLPAADVPASAKDYGGTSGSKGSGEFTPETDWDVNASPVYKRLNEGWYVKMRAAGDEDAPPYELVKAADAPALARLPEAYWERFDPENADTTDEHVERKQVKDAKAAPEGATQKKDLKTLRTDIKTQQAEVGKLKTAWQQALKGIPEDERPAEPDWDAVDASELGGTHTSREDQRHTFQNVHEEYASHLDTLRDEVDATQEHAANHRTNAAASAKAKAEWDAALADVPEEDRPEEPDWRTELEGDTGSHANWLKDRIQEAKGAAEEHGASQRGHSERAEKARETWRAYDAGVKGWVAELRGANDTAQADEDLNDGPIADVAGHDLPELADDGDAGAAEHLSAVRAALDALRSGSNPEHPDAPLDPDNYEFDEEAEAPEMDTPEEDADNSEAAAEAHRENLTELHAEVPGFAKSVRERSKQWRVEQKQHLDAVRAAIAKALALPAAEYTDSDGPGAVHADLTALNAEVEAAIAQLAAPVKPVDLSVTLGPGGDATAVASMPNRLMRQRKATLARLLTLAMVRQQQEATEAGNSGAAAGSLAALAKLATSAPEIARIVGMKGPVAPPDPDEAVEMSWVPYLARRGPKSGQQVGWQNSENPKDVRYQTAKPGEQREKRGASAERGLAIAKKVLTGEAHAGDISELATHLPVMTVQRLKNVRAILDASFGGDRRKGQMVDRLLAHVNKLVPSAAAKPAAPAAAESPAAELVPATPAPVPAAPEPEPATPGTPVKVSKPKARTKVPPSAPPAAKPEKVMDTAGQHEQTALAALHASHAASGRLQMASIPEMRVAFEKAHPLATRGDFDEALLALRRNDRVRLIPADDRSRYSSADLKNGVHAVGDNFQHAEPTETTPPPPEPAPDLPKAGVAIVKKTIADAVASGDHAPDFRGKGRLTSASLTGGELATLAPAEVERRQAARIPGVGSDSFSHVAIPFASPPPAAPAPARTDRGSLESIKESTDRALGVKKPEALVGPKSGQYAAWLRAAAADPAALAKAAEVAKTPLVDRAELLRTIGEVYGPAVAAGLKTKSKGAMAEALKGLTPAAS